MTEQYASKRESSTPWKESEPSLFVIPIRHVAKVAHTSSPVRESGMPMTLYSAGTESSGPPRRTILAALLPRGGRYSNRGCWPKWGLRQSSGSCDESCVFLPQQKYASGPTKLTRVTIRQSHFGPRTCFAGLFDRSRWATARRMICTRAPPMASLRWVGVRSFHFFFGGCMPVLLGRFLVHGEVRSPARAGQLVVTIG